MLSQEEGPFSLFQAYRNLFITDGWVARGVRCFACTSFWVALLIALIPSAYVPLPSWGDLFIQWMGYAGAALVIDRYWKR